MGKVALSYPAEEISMSELLDHASILFATLGQQSPTFEEVHVRLTSHTYHHQIRPCAVNMRGSQAI